MGGWASQIKKITWKIKIIYLIQGRTYTDDQIIKEHWIGAFEKEFIVKPHYSANCKGENNDSFHDYPISKEGLKKVGIDFHKDLLSP